MAADERIRRERKIVTVLFADLAGFTARADTMDPEDVAALLDPYHAALKAELERFGGTVEKFIGDAVMAVFGAPVAHEDDAERAVRAAISIRDWASEEGTELRIGINTGEALVTLGARPAEGQAIAAGDVVNTAARLQAAAPTGGILVGAQTFRATERVVDYEDVEPVSAKGKAEPVPAWLARGLRSRAHVERAHGAELVGRERELTMIVGSLDRARGERSPELVTLVGVPGIGKSRLVLELYNLIDAEPGLTTWRHGRCLPYGDGVTFWALGEMVKAHAGILEGDDEAEAVRKLAAVVDDPWVESHLRPLVGLAAAAEGGGDRRDESFAAWRRYFEALADVRPLVLVFEDLHWADDNLLDFVDHLVDWASSVPLLVVCTARPELLTRRPGWGGGKPNALTVSLAPLSDAETAKLVAGLLARSVLEAETQAQLLARAGGNPLYAEEYTRMLRERGLVEELPETVQGLIAARIDLLEPHQKALLQDAAVVGRTFWLGALAAEGAEQALHALERREFVRRERNSSVAGDTEYAFRHVLVRDVAYGQIPRADRATKHLRTAEWLEQIGRPEDHAEMLAHHYLQALELSDAAGVETASFAAAARSALSDAGDRAAALNAHGAAMRFYRAALDLPGGQRGQLLLRLGRAAYYSGGEAAPALTEAHDEFLAGGDVAGAADAERLLCEHYWLLGERDLAWKHLSTSRELVATLPPSQSKAMTTATAARLYGLGGEEQEAMRLGREATAMAEELGLGEVQAAALINVGTVRHVSTGDVQGLAELEEGERLARLANLPFEVCRAMGNLAAQFWVRGELDRAFGLWVAAGEEAVRYGQRGFAQWFRGVAITNLYRAGRWDESLRAAAAFISEVEAGAAHYLAGGAYLTRGLIRFARDEHEPAQADVEHAVELSLRAGDPQTVLPVGAYAALLAQETGDMRAAESHARPFLDRLLEGRGVGFAISIANVAAWPLTAVGGGADLVALLQRFPFPWASAACAIAEGDPVRAAEVCAGIGAREEEAYARLVAARAGDVSQIERALAFYRAVGATRYIRECEALTERTAISGA